MKNQAINPNYKKQKAFMALQSGNLREAKNLLGKICKSNKRDVEAWLLLASTHGQLGDMQGVTKACQQILSLQPDHPRALSLLGNAQASQGQHKAAIANYEKALALKPGDIAILNNLGNALYITNRLDEAAETLIQVVRRQPDYADAHNNLGNIYKALNKNNEAIHHFQQALTLKPDLFETLLNLGNILSDRIGHPEAAENYFRKALALKPDDIQAHSGVINMLRFQGRLDESMEAVNTALRFNPDHLGSLARIADLYEQQGEHDKAYTHIRMLLEKNDAPLPLLIEVMLRICKKVDCCDEAIKRAQDLLAKDTLGSTSRQTLHFELGKLYDKANDYDSAFQHYHSANEAAKPPFEQNEVEQVINSLTHAYNKETLSRLPHSSNESHRPVFIVGMPRSGTSLTEQILGSHPDVFAAGEMNEINDLAASMPALLGTDKPHPTCLKWLNQNTVDQLSQRYLNKLDAFSTDARYVTDKMPHNFMNLGLIALLFPEARIIHCVRDPRDTCLSIYFQNFGWLHRYGADLVSLGVYYRQYKKLMQHWEDVLDLPMLTVRYEDMVADQEAVSRKMIAFCDLEWDEHCLQFHKSERHVATASYDQVRQKIYTQSKARWKNYEQHITPLIEALGDNIE
ncbi:MAG: tetratricopeptide repeat protein [Gammaproteobacteria bacterium]|nr:tetratricopeptide repeat protein [Gammaproteobacteria bacterium]